MKTTTGGTQQDKAQIVASIINAIIIAAGGFAVVSGLFVWAKQFIF